MYRVVATRTFRKDFDAYPADLQERIRRKVRTLETDPRRHKRLRGELKGLWSLRVGDYRVVYEIEEEAGRVVLLFTGHRRSVYR